MILITGAGAGVGEALAYARARVVLAGRRFELVEAVANAVTTKGGATPAIKADVAEEDCVRNMIEQTVAKFGRPGGAFNNAGVEQTPARVMDTTVADLEHHW